MSWILVWLESHISPTEDRHCKISSLMLRCSTCEGSILYPVNWLDWWRHYLFGHISNQFLKQSYTCTFMYTLKCIQHETNSEQENCLLEWLILCTFLCRVKRSTICWSKSLMAFEWSLWQCFLGLHSAMSHCILGSPAEFRLISPTLILPTKDQFVSFRLPNIYTYILTVG